MPAVSKAQQEAMDDRTVAYIAGFFDGEGYATIRRANRYRNNGVGTSYRFVLGFTNTNLPILAWIQSKFGGRIYSKVRKSSKHSLAFELMICRKSECLTLLNALKPFVRIKSQQIELGIEFFTLGKMVRTVQGRGKNWPLFKVAPGEVEKREGFKIALSAMNKRGAS